MDRVGVGVDANANVENSNADNDLALPGVRLPKNEAIPGGPPPAFWADRNVELKKNFHHTQVLSHEGGGPRRIKKKNR